MWIAIGIIGGAVIGGGIVFLLVIKWLIDIFMWR